MKKYEIGSIFLAADAGDDVALQLIGRHGVVGDVARVCRIRDANWKSCDHFETLFVIGFPFSAAIKDGYLKHAGACPVPESLAAMDFRFPNNLKGEKPSSWTILSRAGQKIVKDLDDRQILYPLAYAVNIQKLEELILKKWNGFDLIS